MIKILSSIFIKDLHIKVLCLGKDGSTFNGFAWNAKNSALEKYLKNDSKNKINIAGNMRLNEWKGKKKVDFIIEDIALY